jgi:hypothetical protein
MTHTLPPLNPMHRAPRDGTRIIVMGRNGETASVVWLGGAVQGWEPPIGETRLAGSAAYYGDELLGWWPMPEVRE